MAASAWARARGREERLAEHPDLLKESRQAGRARRHRRRNRAQRRATEGGERRPAVRKVGLAVQIEELTSAAAAATGARLPVMLDARRDPAAPALEKPVTIAPVLIVDFVERRVAYRGVDVTTPPPHNFKSSRC